MTPPTPDAEWTVLLKNTLYTAEASSAALEALRAVGIECRRAPVSDRHFLVLYLAPTPRSPRPDGGEDVRRDCPDGSPGVDRLAHKTEAPVTRPELVAALVAAHNSGGSLADLALRLATSDTDRLAVVHGLTRPR